MTTIHFQTHVSESGVVTLPPLPETFYGENVTVKVDVKDPSPKRSFEELCGVWGSDEDREDVDRMVAAIHGDDDAPDPAKILPNGKTALDDFLDFCKELNLPPLTDEEVDQAKYDYLMEKYG